MFMLNKIKSWFFPLFGAMTSSASKSYVTMDGAVLGAISTSASYGDISSLRWLLDSNYFNPDSTLFKLQIEWTNSSAGSTNSVICRDQDAGTNFSGSEVSQTITNAGTYYLIESPTFKIGSGFKRYGAQIKCSAGTMTVNKVSLVAIL